MFKRLLCKLLGHKGRLYDVEGDQMDLCERCHRRLPDVMEEFFG